MITSVWEIEPDWEVMILDLEKEREEVTEELLGKDFWTKGEWNEIVMYRNKLSSKINMVKKRLREE